MLIGSIGSNRDFDKKTKPQTKALLLHTAKSNAERSATEKGVRANFKMEMSLNHMALLNDNILGQWSGAENARENSGQGGE